MKRILIASTLAASLGPAAAETSLREMFDAAASCSDASLQDYASRTCDTPGLIAAQAVATCRGKWDAVATRAIGPATASSSATEHARSLKTYADAMVYEYSQAAALKAIDLRAAAGTCEAE